MAETMPVKWRPLESHIQCCYCDHYDNTAHFAQMKNLMSRGITTPPEEHDPLVAKKGQSLRQTDFFLPSIVVLNVRKKDKNESEWEKSEKCGDLILYITILLIQTP